MKNVKSIKNFVKRNRVYVTILFMLLMSGKVIGQCSNVDQSQLTYNGGMSARTLPQYTVWQDFTPGITGTLCEIDMGFFNAMTGTSTLNIYAGTGTGGTLLQTQLVTVSGTGNFFQAFSVWVPVISGSEYTFQFIPTQGGTLPDPYGVQVESPGTYAGGEMEISDPSGTYTTGFDMVFKTYVTLSTNVSENELNVSGMRLFPNPMLTETVLRTSFNLVNASLSIYNVLGQEVKTMQNLTGQEIIVSRDKLKSGLYFVKLVENNKTIATEKLIITDY